MYYGIKQVIKFKNKDSLMYKIVNDLIDDILNNPIDHDSFDFLLLPGFSVDNMHLCNMRLSVYIRYILMS